MNIKTVLGAIIVAAAFTSVQAQTGATPAKSAQDIALENRVANEMKVKQLRKEAEEKLAVEESNRIAQMRPEDLLGSGRTFYISSDTDFFEEVQLQNALRKQTEFSAWQLSILDGWKSREVADVWVEVDRPLFTYTFTYQLFHRSTGKVLATGKVTAFDGNLAAPKLAERIIQDIKRARESAKK
jgi:hypothetical protein